MARPIAIRSRDLEHRVPLVLPALLLIVVACGLLYGAAGPATAQPRSLGLDVSAWQGNMSQTTWNKIKQVENRDFVFIRSSRGGTTGFYNQSDPNNNNGQNTLSQRYDDPYFVQNITRATNAGMFAGAYHFSRPDIVESTLNSGGIANTGADEADHFIQMAGAWMRPGYLLPVHDFEAGDGVRSSNEMAQFAIDFSDRIYEVMGIRPAIYVNGNFANFVIGGASASLRSQVVDLHPTLWSARWPNQADPDSIPVQTGHPGDSIPWVYGPWDDLPNPAHPWAFWQYASTGRLQSFKNGTANLDLNVAQGGVEFVKDQLVPAIWVHDNSGQWTDLLNWNSGQTPVAPVQGPGQVPRVGSLTLPAVRLPGSDDTVILDRPTGSLTVTLSSGMHNIRKLYVREALDITGGSLTVNYVPSPDSTPFSAQFSGPVSLSGSGSLSVHTLQVDSQQTFTLGGGTLVFDTLKLMPHSATPARILISGHVNIQAWGTNPAVISHGAGPGNAGFIDLGGADRALFVADGAAEVDLSIEVPVVNGSLTKDGPGTLALKNPLAYAGDTTIAGGILQIDYPFLADTSDVYLSTTGTLHLNFAGTDTVGSLFIDELSQALGTYGAIGSGADFELPLFTGSGLLQVTTATLPGDFNGDGIVDAADYTVWRDGLGGEYTQADYAIWKNNFGASASNLRAGSSPIPVPTPAAVPEPPAVVLAAGCLAFAFAWHRCRSA